MRDETAIARVEEDLVVSPAKKVLDYGRSLPATAPESFAETLTSDPRKMKLVYDSEAGVWVQVGSDSLAVVKAKEEQ